MKTRLTFPIGFIAVMLLSIMAGRAHGQDLTAAHTPRDRAAVTISFSGMQALFFGAEDRVSVGVLNAPGHTPKLTVTRVSAAGKEIIATLGAEQLHGSLFIDVEGSRGVSRWRGQSMSADANDSRWWLDMNELYPNRQLTINESKLWGKIHVSTGLFYANNLTDAPAKFFSTTSNGKTLPIKRRFADVAAKVFMNDGEVMVISGNLIAPIRLKAEKGITYEIAISNLPKPEMASMDHFQYFYEIINEPLERYVPVQLFKAAFNPFPLICPAVTFSGNQLPQP